jgi:thiol-disulfide isomerase/thioredoxin
MKIPRRVRRVAVFAAAFFVGLWIADRFMGAQAAFQQLETTTRSTTAPSTQASIDPAAQALLTKVAAAYATQPLVVEGSLSIDFDVAGMKQQRTSKLAGSAISPTQFKHEIEGEVQIVVDGESSNILDLKQNQYLTTKLEKAANIESDKLVIAMLREQNPALLLSVTGGASQLLFVNGESVTVDAGASTAELDVLLATGEKELTRYYVEKATGRIERVEVDFRGVLEREGASQIKSASAVIRYTKTDLTSTASAASFAFKPPADAIEASRTQGKELLGAAGESTQLVGKPAPAFDLADPEGKTISLVSLKGNVVVLDFWATWCGPCRVTLPLLDKVATEHAGRDVVVLAINVGEDAGTVSSYLAEQKLAVTALLDKDTAVSKAYFANAIPQTVVIGRDGVVRHVSIGATSNYETELRGQIDAALK